MINKISTDKASYNKNNSVSLNIKNDDNQDFCIIEIFEMEKQIKSFEVELRKGINSINLGSFDNKLAGYRVLIKFANNIYTTSFSMDPEDKIIRYGFLCDFKDMDNNEDIEWMNSNHLNYIQFYDWSYRHHEMVSPSNIYKDTMGKENNLEVIKNKIKKCNEYGMKTMAYGPVYAAGKEYYMGHKDQAYFTPEKKPLTFIDVFYFMNINRKSPWTSHIISQYRKAIKEVGFTGIHLDTYGYPKRALDNNGELKNLEKELPLFLDMVSNSLGFSPLIFNNVGAWPLSKIMDCNQKAIYIEVWPPYETFYHLKELINKSKESLKPVILAAYITPFRLDRERALYSALLTTFYINSLGATHLFLGEKGSVITQGYYCDYTKLKKNEINRIQKYQDFFVSYQELLFDDSLKDVSMTHCGWDNEEYIIEGNYSLTAEANKISTIIRTNGEKHLICLLNLEGNDNEWNTGKNEPKNSSKLKIEIQVFKNVKNIYFANPDDLEVLPNKIKFVRRIGKRSDLICFEVPSFEVGSIIWLEEK